MGKREDIKPLPTLERLNALFAYDPVSGDLRWKSIPSNFRRAKVGDLVGTVNTSGYRVVGIERVYYYAHRIIWKMMTGLDPVDQIDHADGDRLNNRWANFRGACNSENRWNTRLAKNNSSGTKGVCWDKSHNAWVAYIAAGSGHKIIGRFQNKTDAIAARLKAAEELHGQFMRLA
jgi:hypothetical protein